MPFVMRAAAVAAVAILGALFGCERDPRDPDVSARSAEPLAGASEAAAPADTLLPVNGTRLFVHREGAGEPAIVIHGGPVLDHGYLRPYPAPLGEEMELVYYDQRLSGRSEGIVDSASVRLDTFVADIEALREALGFEHVHLIGHSWGGLLAMKYATVHPERLRSLILIGPLPPTAALWQEEEAALAAAIAPEDTAGMGALRASPEFEAREPDAVERMLRLSFRSAFHDPTLAEELEFHIEPDHAERSRQFGFILADLREYDLVEPLRSVEAPALIVYGAEELGAEIAGGVLVRTLPNATLITIPEAGHFPFVERPVAFLGAVREFLGAARDPSVTEGRGRPSR